MNNRKYPRIGSERKIKPKGACIVCGKGKSDMIIDLQFNWFRGDDEVYAVHKLCYDEISNEDDFIELIYDKAGIP